MRALFFLEYRYARHQLAAIVKSPLRLAIWIPYAIAIGFLAFSRLSRRGMTSHGGSPFSNAFHVDAHNATTIGGIYLGLLGITLTAAAFGRAKTFRFRNEAMLLANSAIPPMTIAIWLQIRKLSASALRYAGSLAYVFLIFSPKSTGLEAAIRAFGASLLAIVVQMSAELPMFLLARERSRLALAIGSGLLALVGFAYAALGFFGGERFEPIVRRIGFDPGFAARAVLEGNPLAIAALVAVLGIFALMVRLLGNDALPELYAASQQVPVSLRRRRAARPDVRYSYKPADVVTRVPVGALSMIWKDWLGFKRGRGSVAVWLGGTVFWALCGIGVGIFARTYADETVLTLVGVTAVMIFIGAPLAASVRIAEDLGKPLFWLSRSPLRSRIAAWTVARSWRGAIALAIGPIAAGLFLRDYALAFGALPLVAVAFWGLQSLGIGLYALFPNPIDARGPMMLLRMFIMLAFATPSIIAGTAVGFFTGNALLGIASATIVFAVESWVTIELASMRFAEHGAGLATAARAV